MELNMSKISSSLNDYAIEKLYEIIEKYGAQLNDDQLEMLNDLIASNHVIVIHAFDDEVKKHFNGEPIPPGSGPRSWGDGLIHLYPFFYDNTTTEEVIETYTKNGVITHELFHYLIRLDELNEFPEYDKYFSYLNEGFVQYLTEQTEEKVFSSINYRRNVEFVKELLNKINNNLKGIIRKRLNPDEISIINEMYNNYLHEQQFIDDLNNYLKTVSGKVNIPHDKLVHYYQRKSINDIKEDMYEQLLKTDDEDLKKEFDELISNYEAKQNKKAY